MPFTLDRWYRGEEKAASGGRGKLPWRYQLAHEVSLDIGIVSLLQIPDCMISRWLPRTQEDAREKRYSTIKTEYS